MDGGYKRMISNCSINELGKISGGKPGDNNGREWLIRSWYSYPWNCVLRHPEAQVRAKIADLAYSAAKNNNIGYNQLKRKSFWNELQKANYDAAAIKNKCDSDCSASVAAIVKATGYLLNNEKLKKVSPDCYTGNLKAALKAAGFTVLTDSKYLTSDKYLLKGDILLRENHHTCINLTDGAKATTTKPAFTVSVLEWQKAAKADGFTISIDGIWGSQCEKVARKAVVKKRLIYKYRNLTKLLQRYLGVEADGKCGTQTANAIKAYQKKEGLIVDGAAGIKTWEHILIK